MSQSHERPLDVVLEDLTRGQWPAELPPKGRDDEPEDGIRYLLENAEPAEAVAALVRLFPRLILNEENDLVPLSRLLVGLTQSGARLRDRLDPTFLLPLFQRVLHSGDRIAESQRSTLLKQIAGAWIEYAANDILMFGLLSLPAPQHDKASLFLLAVRRRIPESFLDEAERWLDHIDDDTLLEAFRFYLAGVDGPQRAERIRGQLVFEHVRSVRLQELVGRVLRELSYVGWSSNSGARALPFRRFGASSEAFEASP